MSFKKKVKLGLKWSAIAQTVIQFIKVGRWIILLYFLTPDDFGLFAIALLVVGLPQSLLSDAIGAGIIQSKEVFSIRDLSTFQWLLSGFSFFLLMLFTVFSGYIADFFDEAELIYLVIILSFANLIESFGGIAGVLLRKSLYFKFLAKVEIISFLLSTILLLLLAYWGFGYWALAGGLLLSYLSNTIFFLYKSKFRASIVFNIKSVFKIYAFSRDLAFFRLLTYLMRYSDDFIIGYFFGKNTLGVYDRAYQIVHMPMRLIANKINSVLFPSYSSNGITDESRKEIHLKIIHYSGLFYIPLLGIIFLFSELTVNLFLPENWSQLPFYLIVLSVGGILHAFLNFNESLFLAKGKSNLQLKYGLITRSIIVFAYILGAYWGAKGIAVGYTIGSFFAFFIESRKVFQEINSTLSDFWKAVRTTLGFFFVVTLFVFFLLTFLENDLLKLILGGFLYIFCSVTFAVFTLKSNKHL